MPKICTPPPFNGGQKAGQLYQLRMDYLIAGRFVRTLGTSAPFNRVGKLSMPAVVPRPNTIYNNGVASFAGGTGNDIVLTFNSGNNQDRLIFDTRSLSVISFTVLSPYPDSGGDIRNCYCSDDSCRVDCATSQDGFCCIDHKITDRLIQVIS